MAIIIALLIIILGTGVALGTEPGEKLNVSANSDTPDVVLIPGLSGCAYGFRQVLPLLEAADLSWAIIEPLGIGGSPRPAEAAYSLTAQSDRVAAVLDNLKSPPVIVLGHGVSASIALRLALRRPDLVRAVISIEGGADENAATPTVQRSLKWASLAAKLGGGRILRDRFKSDMEGASGDHSWVTGYTVRKYFSHANRDLSGAIDALRAMAQADEPQSLRDHLGQISCPVLLMLGGAPHASSLEPSEQAVLSEGLPDFTTRIIPGAGHFIFEEQPDAVAQAIIGLATMELTVTTTEQGSLSCAQ